MNKIRVGYIRCCCCSMQVSLLNNEGIHGSPEKDYIERHRRHNPQTPDEQCCPSFKVTLKSRRFRGEFLREAPARNVCDHLPLASGNCLCGVAVVA